MLVALWLLGSCTADDGGRDDGDSGALLVESEIHGPGTELGHGFTVAEGSVLIGEVFPLLHPDSSGEVQPGWRSELYVTGDFDAVLDRYRRQAEQAGVPLRSSSGGCGNPDGVFVKCSFQGFGGTADRPLKLDLRAHQGIFDGEAVSHLGLQLTEPSDRAGFTPPPDVRPRQYILVPDISEPAVRPRRPSPGDLVGPAIGEERRRFRVEEGTTVIAPVYLESSAGPGFEMIATVDDREASAVAASYRAQAEEVLESLHLYEWVTESSTGSRGTSHIWIGLTKRARFEVQIFEPDRGPPLVRVQID